MNQKNPVLDAVRYALTAGVAASFAGAASAVSAQDDVAVQDKVTVTGSRIKCVDIEGPSPISVISREDIDASGEVSVAEVLRGTSSNSFGSFKQSSGSSAQSRNTVSLRGLGAGRTLVLLDGRRITGSPSFGAGNGNGDGTGWCQYNYAGVAANEADNDTKSFFVNVNYDINETTTFFARGTSDPGATLGASQRAEAAPAPVPGVDRVRIPPPAGPVPDGLGGLRVALPLPARVSEDLRSHAVSDADRDPAQGRATDAA